jgi:RNA polymerase sigma factor (TIGR02999 family)
MAQRTPMRRLTLIARSRGENRHGFGRGPQVTAIGGRYAPSGTDRDALDRLFSLAYEELRRLAASVKRRDPGATLSPTTLVNEAWLKLVAVPSVADTSPLHFKRIAGRAMRQVLVDLARRRNAEKRGGPHGVAITFDEGAYVASGDEEILALDAALEELARLSPRQAQMVEGRFFGGLDVAETAAMLEISEATVLRDWRAARAWLAAELRARH